MWFSHCEYEHLDVRQSASLFTHDLLRRGPAIPPPPPPPPADIRLETRLLPFRSPATGVVIPAPALMRLGARPLLAMLFVDLLGLLPDGRVPDWLLLLGERPVACFLLLSLLTC